QDRSTGNPRLVCPERGSVMSAPLFPPLRQSRTSLFCGQCEARLQLGYVFTPLASDPHCARRGWRPGGVDGGDRPLREPRLVARALVSGRAGCFGGRVLVPPAARRDGD